MNLTQKYVQSILRNKYQLKLGNVKSGPYKGRYLLLRTQLLTNEVLQSDLQIAADIGVSVDLYRRLLIRGLHENTDYVKGQSFSGHHNIYFNDAKKCLTAMYRLYQGLERWEHNESTRVSYAHQEHQKLL